MGILDSIIGEENKTFSKEEKAENIYVERKMPVIPFRVSTSFLPLRLSAMKANSVNLVIKLINITKDRHLVSVDVSLPKSRLLGFDQTCINKAVEKRLGEIGPGESAEVSIPVWANNQTESGEYEMDVTAYAHYQDYNKVLASVKRKASLRVV